MSVITLEFPPHTYVKKTENSVHPDTGYYRDGGFDMMILRAAPETLVGRQRHVVTSYNKLNEYCMFQSISDPVNALDYIDQLVEFIDKGVLFRPDIKFKRGSGMYFKLDLIVKVSNAEYNNAMPVGAYESLKEDNTQKTWAEFVTDTKGGNVAHENDTHKFFYYNSASTHDEYVALLNHIATINNTAVFDVLSPTEFNAQVELDNAE